MGYDLWVVPYPVSRFPHDRRQSYRVFQCQPAPQCEGACRHHVTSQTLHQAKMEAWLLHERGINCGGIGHGD
jgi:hypothetical protein